jgi:hypothetical protein
MARSAWGGSPNATTAAAIKVPKKIIADWINNFIAMLPWLSGLGCAVVRFLLQPSLRAIGSMRCQQPA